MFKLKYFIKTSIVSVFVEASPAEEAESSGGGDGAHAG